MYVCVCMYVILLTSAGLQVFLEGSLLLQTKHFYRYHLYQPLSTGSGSILGAGANRA